MFSFSTICVFNLTKYFPLFSTLLNGCPVPLFFFKKAVSSLSFPTGFVVKAPFLIMTENISAATWDEKSILSVENQSGRDKRCYTHTKRKKTRGFDKMLILTDFSTQRITMKPSSIWRDDSWKHSKRIPNYSIVLKWLHWLKFTSKRTSTWFLQVE